MDKNYFIMIAESPWAGPTVKVLHKPEVDVMDGLLVGEVGEPFRLELITDPRALPTEPFPPRDLHEGSAFVLFSRKFIHVLEDLGVDNIEYLTAEVTNVRTEEVLDYSIANILGRMNALDEEASEFILSSRGNIMGIEKMVFDEKKIGGQKMFLLGELPLLIVVHRSVKEAVEANGLTGFVFLSEEEYEPGMI